MSPQRFPLCLQSTQPPLGYVPMEMVKLDMRIRCKGVKRDIRGDSRTGSAMSGSVPSGSSSSSTLQPASRRQRRRRNRPNPGRPYPSQDQQEDSDPSGGEAGGGGRHRSSHDQAQRRDRGESPPARRPNLTGRNVSLPSQVPRPHLAPAGGPRPLVGSAVAPNRVALENPAPMDMEFSSGITGASTPRRRVEELPPGPVGRGAHGPPRSVEVRVTGDRRTVMMGTSTSAVSRGGQRRFPLEGLRAPCGRQ